MIGPYLHGRDTIEHLNTQKHTGTAAIPAPGDVGYVAFTVVSIQRRWVVAGPVSGNVSVGTEVRLTCRPISPL